MATEGIEVHVRNSAVLRDTALVEAFNLKAAIEFQLNNIADAKEALTDMPPRAQQDIDAVSLHNQALIQVQYNLNFFVTINARLYFVQLLARPQALHQEIHVCNSSAGSF